MIRRLLGLTAFAFAFALTAGAYAQSSTPSEDDRARAREQFGLGVERYEDGNYQGALEAFQEAYRLAPHPTVRVNMANCYEHLERPLEAMHHFERFLAEAEGASRQQRREVQAALRRLEGQLGQVRLAIAPDGARVVIDNAETRVAPVLEPVRLVAGTHHLTVRMDGYRTEHREVEVTGGSDERISIRLERGADEPAAVADAAPDTGPSEAAAETGDPVEAGAELDATADADEAVFDEAPSEGGGFELRLTTPVIIAGSVTAAFTVAAVVTGIVAISANSSFEDAVLRSNDGSLSQAERNAARQEGLDAAGLANTTSVLTDVFIIGAVAGAAATAFFVIIGGLDGGDEDQLAGQGFELRAAPSAGRDGGGVVLTGRF
ncbi:MAG TPA: hypothetical protein DEF51_07770 [Myxococcales bacterium]|mgnify:CR=1 FL=1|nr:hypothetical protein [Myxococcales bacterium]